MDPKLIVDLFFGLLQLGWAMQAPTMQLREAPPEYPIEAFKADCGDHNSKLISRCRPSGDDKLDNAAWEKTEEELSSEMFLGPFFDLQDAPFPIVRLLRRFDTWEQHGGAENPTVRLIDDALEGGQNGATGSQFTHRPTDLDSWATQCRMVQERFPQSPLSQFPSDFKKACKQVPAAPSLAGFAVMVQWHPRKRCPAFLVGRTQFFGGKSCPVNFARVPDWCCHVLATMAGFATSHCVDDVLAVDRKTTIFSGWLVWRVLAACCGWVVPDSKSPLPSQVHRILGATSDLSQTPSNTFNLTRQRVSQLTCMVKDILESSHLHPSMAGKVWGRLEFCCTQMFGRFGRAKLRPFSRRQHEHRRIWLNHQLTSALKWWLEILSCSPPRVIPTNLSERRRIVSYSDGEGSEAGVGVA